MREWRRGWSLQAAELFLSRHTPSRWMMCCGRSLPRCDILSCKLRWGSWWRVTYDQSQFGGWSSEDSSCRLNINCSDQPVFARKDLDDFSQRPVIGKRWIFGYHHDVSKLEVRLASLPLVWLLEVLQILCWPPPPEVMNNGLTEYPPLMQRDVTVSG